MSTMTRPVRVQVTLRGDAGYGEGDAARAAVARAIACAHCPVRWADVTVDLRRDPASTCPAEVEAVIDVGSALVEAISSAPTISEAIDVVENQLCARLIRYRSRAQTARRVPRRPAPLWRR